MLVARIMAALGVALVAVVAVSPAQAVTMTECSTMYKAAQTAGTLNGVKWNDYRKANCSSTAATTTPAAAGATAPAAAAATAKPAAPAKPTAAAAAAKKAPAVASTASEPSLANTDNSPEPAATKAIAPKGVVFPKAVSAQYSSESAGKARMHTCLDQYKQNKANNSLAGMTWIQSGGGYYSICNTKLKG